MDIRERQTKTAFYKQIIASLTVLI